MKLIANKQLTGSYGTVTAGTVFDVDDEAAKQLIVNGSARGVIHSHKVLYETKVIVAEAPEVSARHGFRDVLVSDEEPAGVVAESDSMLPGSDLS